MNKDTGFSLLEVLVALAVVGIALSAAMSATSRSADNLSVLERRTLATWVAENQITNLRLELMRNLELPGDLSGEERMAGRNWYWSAKVETTDDEMVNRMILSVSQNSDMRTIDAEVLTYYPVLN